MKRRARSEARKTVITDVYSSDVGGTLDLRSGSTCVSFSRRVRGSSSKLAGDSQGTRGLGSTRQCFAQACQLSSMLDCAARVGGGVVSDS